MITCHSTPNISRLSFPPFLGGNCRRPCHNVTKVKMSVTLFLSTESWSLCI